MGAGAWPAVPRTLDGDTEVVLQVNNTGISRAQLTILGFDNHTNPSLLRR